MLFVKFAAVRPGADQEFEKLLNACEALAADWRAERMQAGVNTARRGAYTSMLARGYRAEIVGVAMHRPDQAGYNRSDMFVIDDWR